MVYDVGIIGAGPAGLTAALYAARAGKSAVIFEQLTPGGQIINSPDVANHPGFISISGADLTMQMMEAAANAGAELHYNKVLDADLLGPVKKLILDNGDTAEMLSVIIANGVSRRKLAIPGEAEFSGRGVSYCATCDGGFYKHKVTAVIGGGNTALDDAMYLCGVCDKVYLIHRRDSFRGNEMTVQKLKEKKNLTMVLNAMPKEIFGDTAVKGLRLSSTVGGEDMELILDGVFVAVGSIPDNGMFPSLTDRDGFLKSGENCLTEIPGVYVAGDTRQKELRQLVTAESDGAIAATAAAQYVDSL